MSVPILVCECGMRLKAPGAVPGRVGRCPKCKGMLKFPEVTVPAASIVEDEPSSVGYFLEPGSAAPSSSSTPRGEPRARKRRLKPTSDAQPARTTTADGLLPSLASPETGSLASFLYPLRGPETMGFMAILGTAFWALTILLPEYCLTLMADAESLGATAMGHLVSLITSLPAVILIPPTMFYFLQYLGRVLVSSAMGETAPPRLPDRNFDGFLSGLSPWFIWLLLGVPVGALPFVIFVLSQGSELSTNRIMAFGLILVGFPYALMALMLSFLHDDAMAAKPSRVLGTLSRFFPSFLGTSAVILAALATGAGIFALAFLLRANHFWLYVLASLASWVCLIWILITAMRIAGLFYYWRRDELRWHVERPRWGVAWKL